MTDPNKFPYKDVFPNTASFPYTLTGNYSKMFGESARDSYIYNRDTSDIYIYIYCQGRSLRPDTALELRLSVY